MKTKIFITLIILLVMFTGCSNLLPSVKNEIVSSWNDHNSIQNAYDNIIINSTTKPELHNLGFNPQKTSNIKLLNYVDIMDRFIINSSISLSDLDTSLQKCLEDQQSCIAYESTFSKMNKKRYGNFFLDLFNFRKKSKITGWEFYSLIIMHKNIVVYKVSNSSPNIQTREDKKNPLGPFQSMESIIKSSVK